MNFEEISSRTKIVIAVTNGSDLQAKFMSKVVRNNGKNLMIIPFHYKGKRINFTGNNMKITLEVRDQAGLLWIFKNCHITTVKKDGMVYHKLESGMMSGIQSQRGGRRFYLWESAVFTVEGIENPIFTHLKDIGGEGFAFAVDPAKKYDIKEGNKVSCTAKDHESKEMVIRGMVVRKERLDKYIVYGCRMDETTEQVEDFIKYLEKKNTIVDVDY